MTDLLDSFSGMIAENEPLSRHTYYRIGGPARYLLQPKDENDLGLIGEFQKKTQMKTFILGRGSNVLVADSGFDGIVIKTGLLDTQIEIKETLDDKERIRTGAGVPIVVILRKAQENGWQEFSKLAGVPGSIGGAVFMNAGTYLGETSDFLESVRTFSFKSAAFRERSASEMKYSYRKNHFLERDEIIVTAEWVVSRVRPEEVQKLIKEALERRNKIQPIDKLSCGSVFKNPHSSGLRSWEVIDKIGLRGFRVGGAQFSEKHPNFIVNDSKASAQDVVTLIETAKREAREKLGVTLEEEVQYLGLFNRDHTES